MMITRRSDGLYTSGLVYTTVQGRTVMVSARPYIGKTVASVIAQATGNAIVRRWRAETVERVRVGGRR